MGIQYAQRRRKLEKDAIHLGAHECICRRDGGGWLWMNAACKLHRPLRSFGKATDVYDEEA